MTGRVRRFWLRSGLCYAPVMPPVPSSSSSSSLLRLYGTPLSHFTRKIRVLLEELGVPYELVRGASVLATTPASYGDNPLLRAPTLAHGDVMLIDSDHIARYVVAEHDPEDRLGVNSMAPEVLNRLAVVNGIMANEVVLILAKRGGLTDLDQVAYFRKLATAMDAGLAWLDERVTDDPMHFDYTDIAFICLWQHLAHYQFPMIAPLGDRRRLTARAAQLATRPSILRTTPEVSLAEAKAAGWAPA